MSNRNQEQMNQSQRNRFASLQSRNENILKQKEQAQQVEQSQMQQTPIPQTIILESNRLTSRQEDINAESYSTNHRWTTEYSNGGIQIRKGDEIRINSAYISSIGVGDLIEWDVREDSVTQDNKANWLFSYYGCNDHLNDKRAGYNIKEKTTGGRSYGGNGRFNYDCDNSPCPLFRVTPTSTIGIPKQIFGTEMTGQRLSWLQDPYLKCRFFGETFTIHNPVLDDHYEFILYPKLSLKPLDPTDNLEFATAIQVKKYSASGSANIETIDPRAIMGIGQTLHFKSQTEPFNTTDPNANFHDKNVNDWVFTIQDFRQGSSTSGIADGYVLIVDSLNDLTGQNFPMTANITTTAKVLIGNMPSICSSAEVDATAYQHTALSTIVWTGKTSDNYIEVGDTFKQYKFCGVSFDLIDHTQSNMMEQEIDTQNQNKVLEVRVASSQQTEAETKIKLNMISLIEPTPADHLKDQQVIQFQFENSNDVNSNFQKMKASGGGPNALKVFTEIVGTNCLVFDLFAGSQSPREIATCFLYETDTYCNFDYDTTNSIIQLNNVRRSQNANQVLNVLSDGQPFCSNTKIDSTGDYYLLKTPNFFTDFKATFAHEDLKQYRGETWDWALQTAHNSQNRIAYYCYVKDNNNELTAANLTTINNRDLGHEVLQSNSFNFQNPIDNSNINRPIKYAGYNAIDTDHIRVKHYSQHELKIDENYSSPSDIATALTDQTHYVGTAIDKNGNEIVGSENSGLIQNAYYIPVWSSAGNLTDSSVTIPVPPAENPDENKENALTGKLQGTLQKNSFLLKYKMKNSSYAYYSPPATRVYADDGEYDIYFKTRHTYINKPVAFQDPLKGSLITNKDLETGGHKFSLTADLDQTHTSENAVIPSDTQNTFKLLKTAETFSAKSVDGNPEVIGYPIEYATDSYISQYCGSNNVSISWDDTSSRFKIDFLHMSATSKFEPSEEGVVQEGGALSATIYYPAPVGNNGNLYKMPRTRCGGVNIENWTSQDFSNITTPQQVRTLCNLDTSIDLSTDWFVCDHNNISPNTPQLQKNYDSIGNLFWNKLGFLNSQIYKDQVGSLYDPNTDRYIPKGTTDNLIDVADATITAEEPADNTPYYFTQEKFDGAASLPATYKFSSIGAMNFNNHLSGYGTPNTSGVPLTFQANELLSNLNINIIDSNADKYKNTYGETTTRPPFSEYLSTYNPDREMVNGYSFTTEPKSMTAKSLPIKTEFPYFYIMSDIIETDFNISANKGSGLNCLGVMSKLNAEGDFFFQYQAPQSFFATKDRLISSITTELRTPTLGVPQALSPYSSVIYQISRYAPTAIQVAPPVWAEQKMVFDQMKNLLQDIASSLAPSIPVTADQQIADGMGGQIRDVYPDAPIQNTEADERDIYQSMINSISGRITDPTPETQALLRSMVGGGRGVQNPLQINDASQELAEEPYLDEMGIAVGIQPPPQYSTFRNLRAITRLGTDRNTIDQLLGNLSPYSNQDSSVEASIASSDRDSQQSENSMEAVRRTMRGDYAQPTRVEKPKEDDDGTPSDSGYTRSSNQSTAPPLYSGSQAPTYTSNLTDDRDQTLSERVQEQRKEEEDEAD